MEGFLSDKQYNCCTELPNGSNKIDLTLKLSPCGENAEEMRLTKSSSMAMEIGKISVGDGPKWGPFVPSLDRSCSLPAEAKMDLMRFGYLHSMRRAETGKKMLLERQRRVAAVEDGKFPEVLAWVTASAVKRPLACANDKFKALAKSSGDSKHEDTFTGGSYTIPYMGPRPSTKGGVSSNSNMQTPAKQDNESMAYQKTMAKEIPHRPSDTRLENPAKKVKLGNYCSLKGDVMEILRQMPSVTTTGDGPNGKRIEGFLYKYRTSQVCIVCVCHGNFLTPAEFVMHAGGKEVANPMKHITVYANSF